MMQPLSAFMACMALSLWGTLASASETPFEASQRFIESDQITEARRALESELRMRPDNLDARYNLAVLLETINHHNEAEKLYRKNIATGRHLPSLINLAAVLKEQGNSREAKTVLLKATEQFRSEATPWYLLATIEEESGNTIKARSHYIKATKTDVLNGYAHLYYADFQSRHPSGDRGIKHAERAVKLLPRCAPCWSRYATILHRAGNKAEALHGYQKSLAIEPDNKVRIKLVSLLRSMGERERADQIERGMNAHH